MKNLAMISLLTVSLAMAAVPTLAKDRHYGQDKHRDSVSTRQHDGRYNDGKHYKRSDEHRRYYSGQKYSSKSKHQYRHHHYYNPRQYYGHPRYYYRSNDYVEDYFTILGGSILINELLYHSHDDH
ncbi:MAG: hypothetical protein V7699_05380 [Porticoccus sp.]